MRSLPVPFVLALAACGSATAASRDVAFDVRQVDLGFVPVSVLTLDVDGDGRLDVLVAGDGGLAVLREERPGQFVVHETIDAGANPAGLAAADLDGDGRPDVAVANHETRQITLVFGGRDGFASGSRERLDLDVSPHAHAVALVDVDGDGRLDLVVDDRDREGLLALSGAGDGSFGAARRIPVGGDPYRGMILEDVSGDGFLDVVTPNPQAVAVQLGDGSGSFSPGPRLEAEGLRPFSVAVGDFDGDGVPDVGAGGAEGRGAVALWLGTAEGAFEAAPGSPYAVAEGPVTLAAADVDGDGVDDLLATSYAGDELAVLLGGEGGLRVSRIPLAESPWGVAAGDLNGDGLVDVVTANNGGAHVSILLGREGSR